MLHTNHQEQRRWGAKYAHTTLFSGGMKFSDGGKVVEDKMLNAVVEQRGFLAAFTGIEISDRLLVGCFAVWAGSGGARRESDASTIVTHLLGHECTKLSIDVSVSVSGVSVRSVSWSLRLS